MFAPPDRPRVAVAHDGSLAAFLVVRTVTAVELAGGTAISELDGEPSARAIEIGWLDGLLLALSRDDDGAVVQLVDPWAADVVGELRLAGRHRLLATSGRHALVAGDASGAVITHGGALASQALPELPIIAGATAAGFAYATDGEIVLWDPERGRATRRAPLAEPAARIGGTPRAIWTCPQADAARIDVAPLDGGRPIAHQLPEPIARVAGHPDADELACLGESGALYLVHVLDPARRRTVAMPIEHPEAIALATPDRLLIARGAAPIAITDLDGRDVPPGQRVGAGWRDAVVAWARAVAAGVDRPVPPALPIDVVLHRLELARTLRPAFALLYGLHLAGTPGAAPADLARLGELWPEALGRGALADRRAARLVDSRVELAAAIQRALDELPPATGTLAGEVSAHALAGPCAFIAPDDEPLAAIAARCAPVLGGAILAAHPGTDFDELVFEARVRGAAPMVRLADHPALSTEPVIFVCPDEQRADSLGLRRVSL